MTTNWTTEQSSAINTNGKNILVSAGAGCGKTAILTERIYRLMVENKVNIDEFMVSTFTNAAAKSMKEKIRKKIIEKLPEEKDDKIKSFLYNQLDLIENSNISTLHSFCMNMVREYYVLLNIEPSFDIIDDVSKSMLINKALDKVFESKYANEDEMFIKTSLAYSFNKINGDTKFKELLIKIYTQIYDNPNTFEWFKDILWVYEKDADLNEIPACKCIYNHIIDTCKTNKLKIDALLNDIRNDVILNSRDINNKEKMAEVLIEDSNIFNLIEKHGKENTIEDFFYFIYNENISFKRWNSGKKVDSSDFELKDTIEKYKNKRTSIKDSFNKAFKDQLKALNPSDIKATLNALNPYMNEIYEILLDLDAEYKKLKSDNSVLEFSDLEHLCLKVLANDSAKEEIQEQFKYIFIDEYQDTSPLQEAIIKNISSDNNLFVVGDVKQSIYRFRKADPDIFINRSNKYYEEIDINKLVYMNTNFRTNKELINSINILFDLLMSEQVGKVSYNDNERLKPGRPEDISLDSRIEVHSILKDEEHQDYNKKTRSQVEIEYIANMINSMVGKKTVYDNGEYRPIQYSDICILSRSLSSKTKEIKEVFSTKGIPVSTDKENEYFQTFEIETVKNLLSLINNFFDDLALLSVMRSCIFNFSIDEILEIAIKGAGYHFYEKLINYGESDQVNEDILQKISDLRTTINDYANRSLYESVSDLLSEIYEETNLTYYFAALPFGAARYANLKALITKAQEYESLYSEGLYGFIQFMEYSKENKGSTVAASSNNEENCVSFMTIHKSKGLEFPIVILMDCYKGFNKQDLNDDILLNRDFGMCPTYINPEKKFKINSIIKDACRIIETQELKHEEMRLLYTALTRAKEKVIMTGIPNGNTPTLEKMVSNCPSPSNKEEFNKHIASLNSFFEWIIPALLKDKVDVFTDDTCYEDEYFIFIQDSLSNVEDKKDIRKKSHSEAILDEVRIKQINDRFNSTYVNEINTKIPKKASVTSLNDPTRLEVGNNVLKLKTKPNFKNSSTELDAAQKGNIVHFIFENIDELSLLKARNLRGNIDSQIKNMVKNDILLQEELDSINMDYIFNFYESDLGKQVISSTNVFKELPFTLKIPAKDISDNWKDSEEGILIQGIIDLLFEDENNDMILVDYKTSVYYNENRKEELLKEYSSQLRYYKRAVNDLMEKKVAHSYIYFLSKNEIVEV